ncbi:MAG: peptidylprolyl isomerase [Candidatus Paraprevotella stercoravium]|jgi:peptidyl-prolyl cis-trans isomerase SurA|uniref:Peptidylprolyl isomerase n=2 Tax=Bacteroidales TaxID=171549 RepID=A0ABT7U356_9BACE|nr:peptidylprolyl isomerase [Candidatus Paraprevotella stercoravium]MDM8144952.1 peptidylprolyl isomerase [Bacteroides eggerthii]
MKRLLIAFSLTVMGLSSYGQDDPIVMKINGKNILRSEFEYNYNKNNSAGVADPKGIKDYVPLFVNYKLKVEAAKDARYDTLSSFKKEFLMYRNQQIRSLLIDPKVEESEARKYYDQLKQNIGPDGLIRVAHIFIQIPQKASQDQIDKAKNKIDSINKEIQSGGSFGELAMKFSDDKMSSIRGGELPWLARKQTIKEFEDVAFKLKPGEISQPFLSPLGYHIVRMLEQKQLEPYDTLRTNILKYLESKGLQDKLADQVLDSMVQASNQSLTVAQVLDRETDRLCAQDSDLKYLIQEYHDGLLLFELSSREIWQKAAKDEKGLSKYFRKNKKRYAWDKPHFNGVLYFYRDEALGKKIKKTLKKADERDWAKVMRKTFNKDSLSQVRASVKMFVEGDNPYVDYCVFDSKKKPNERKTYPYYDVYGRKLVKGPKKWTDVKNEVISDYQAVKEKEYIEELRKKYTVEIFEEVLKTVNKH